MKKLLLLSSLFILTSTFLNAQNLALTFDDAKITNDGTNDYYEVDVMIMRTSTSNFKLGTGQFYVDYNPAAFGTSIGDATVDFEYTAGSILAETNVLSIYGDPIINSNTNGTVSIAWQQALSAGSIAADNVTDTPAVLGHLKIQMINLDALVDICFNVIGAAFDDQFYTACGPFTPGLSIVDCTGSNAGTQILNYDGSDCLGAVPIIANAPNPLEACDEFPNDGFAEFDLTIRESQILGDQTGLTVTYHVTQENASSGTNPIANPTSYENLTNPQNVYPRLTNPLNNNFDTTILNLIVYSAPAITDPISDYILCDDNNDGVANFDLTSKDNEIVNGLTDITLTYYTSLADAETATNPIVVPNSYTSTGAETIFVRAESNVTGCSTIGNFNLIINALPIFVEVPLYELCDDDNGDGFEVFDLQSQTPTIVGGDTNLVVSYYNNEVDAEVATNPLPSPYTNITNPETIFVRVIDNTTGCFDTFVMDLVVNPLPLTNTPTPLEACDDNNDGFAEFDLTVKDVEILNGQDPLLYIVSYYETLSDAESNTGPLTSPYTNTTPNTQTVFARLENSSSGCFGIVALILQIETTNPTITCPEDQEGSVDATCNFTLPDYTSLATAADNCTVVTVSQVPVPGTIVALGSTTIVLTVTDGASNTATCTFDVLVSDNTNPTISCPEDQEESVDASCNFTLPDYTSLATTADNCSDVTVTQLPAPGTVVDLGSTTIVLTATDGASNTATCTFDVLVSDTSSPTINCPEDQEGLVDTSCNFTLPDYTSLATAADNCSDVTVTQLPAPGTVVEAGTTTIVLTATDGASNTATCNFDVLVSDNTNPTISCPEDQEESVDASCNFTLPDYTSLATAADNCSDVTVTQLPAPGTVVDLGSTTIALTVTDGSSNTATCTFDVLVSDNTNPTISCPEDQEESVDASCNFTLPDYTSLATAADNCSDVTVTQLPAPGTVVETGTTTIVLTATDGASNTATCNFDVLVSDNINPTINCPEDQEGFVDANCNFTLSDYTSLATAADNCTEVTVSQVPAPGTVVETGTTTIVLTVTDGASNTATCNFDVLVSDNTNPTISCPEDQEESVDASCNFTLPDYTSLATAADNCTEVTVSQVPAPGTIVETGTTTIVLTVTDGSSNTATCNFDVLVSDNTSPTISCPEDQEESVDVNCNFTLPDYTSLATAADNCSDVTVTQLPVAGTVVETGTTTIVLTVTDGASNTATCNFDVLVSDNINPTISCPEDQEGTADASCFTLPDYTSLATAADNCSDVTVSQVPAPGTAVETGTTTIVLTVTDGASNTATCNFDVLVSDTINPTITCPDDQEGSVDANCNFTLPDYSSLATVADNCTLVTVSQLPAPGTVVETGTTTIVLTVTDGSSNTATCNFDVLVSDNTNPTISCPDDQEESVDANCNFTLPDYTSLATAADNCSDVTVTQLPVAGTVVETGTTTIVLTVTDGASNTATCNFDVLVSDSINPTITCPDDQEGSVDVSCNFTLPDYTSLATATDNCSDVTVSQVPAPGTVVETGTTTIVLTVTDGSSNTATCNFDVLVSDNTNPTISCPDDQEGSVDATCNFTLLDYTSLATAADNCTVLTVSQEPAPGTIVETGTTTIVLTVTDGSSNTATCNFNVLVSDTTSPTITCPADQSILLDIDELYEVPDYWANGEASAIDNCTDPVTNFTQDPVAGTDLDFGTYVVLLTAEDEFGNMSSCSFELLIEEILNANETELGSLILYPNPADNYVYLSNPNNLELFDVTVYDLMGRMITKLDLTNMGTEKNLDISKLANATYMILIRGEQGTSYKQLIVNN